MIEIMKSFKWLCISIFNLFVNICTMIVTFWIPKKKNLVIVGGWFGNRFSDNSKYLLLQGMKCSHQNVFFITRDKRIYKELLEKHIPVVKMYSFQSLYLHLRAKYHVIDQNERGLLGFLSVNAIRINLWHGIPLKKIWKLQDKERKNKIARMVTNFNNHLKQCSKGLCSRGRWDAFYLVSPSKFDWDELFSKCIVSQATKPIFCQYPRMEFLRNNTNCKQVYIGEEQNYIDLIKEQKQKNKKILFYVPTFRNKQSTILFGTIDEKKIKEYIQLLIKNNCVLLVKMHSEDKTKLERYENCIVLDSDCDISSFLPYADCLITDYSSVYFDYLVFDRPILFLPYDYQYYKNADRGFLVDYEFFTPGIKSYTIEELFENTKNIIKNNFQDGKNQERKSIFDKVYDLSLPSLFEVIGSLDDGK